MDRTSSELDTELIDFHGLSFKHPTQINRESKQKFYSTSYGS